MKALLMKDFYVISKNLKILLFLILALSLMSSSSSSLIGALFGATLPMTALAYDERSNFNKLSKIYPYSEFSIVFSKYLLGYLCLGLSILLSFISQTIFVQPYDFNMILIGVLIGIIVIAFNLPIMFKFGSEKGRTALIVLIVLAGFLGSLFKDTLSFVAIFNSEAVNLFSISMFAVIFTVISVILSIKANGKKV